MEGEEELKVEQQGIRYYYPTCWYYVCIVLRAGPTRGRTRVQAPTLSIHRFTEMSRALCHICSGVVVCTVQRDWKYQRLRHRGGRHQIPRPLLHSPSSSLMSGGRVCCIRCRGGLSEVSFTPERCQRLHPSQYNASVCLRPSHRFRSKSRFVSFGVAAPVSHVSSRGTRTHLA